MAGGRPIGDEGENAISIFAPKAIQVIEKDDAGAVRTALTERRSNVRRLWGSRQPRCSASPRRRAKAYPPAEFELSETPPAGFADDLEAAITGEVLQAACDDLPTAGHSGPNRKVVVVDSKLSDGSRAATLAHELWYIKTGHLSRMDEYHSGHVASRGAMEVEAESISYAVCRAAGKKTPQQTTATYVAGWGRVQRDGDVVRKSGQTIQKSVHRILTSGSSAS